MSTTQTGTVLYITVDNIEAMMWGGHENNSFRITERGATTEVYVGLLYFQLIT